ncbi:MAG: hypothetical protein AMJ90_00930 [candidate division Zixibacteria bacterium SM23_73_2]|nr:MAG: hypothetical protein AMJ90_00930 [candidate division Zixibacteria bacterium SM23_73_2]
MIDHKRSFYIFFIIVFVLFLTTGCGKQPELEKVTILYWNDFHASFNPYPSSDDPGSPLVSGSAYFSSWLDSLKEKSENCVLVCAGDELVGTPLSTLTSGKAEFEILNRIKPDIFELGNHEFDYGLDNLKSLIDFAEFPIICANVVEQKTGEPLVLPYLILKRGKAKIAFMGLNTEDLKEEVVEKGTLGLKVGSAKKTCQKYLGLLEKEADLIVLVSHMGFSKDKEVAQEVKGIDVIIGGHSHTRLIYPEVINQTVICQAGSKGRYIGKLDLVFDLEKERLINFENRLIETENSKVSPDRAIQRKVDSLEKKLAPDLDKVIGTLLSPWIRSSKGESNLYNWTADVIREYTKSDVAFINSGALRKNLPAGSITIRDIWEINPFSDHFVSFHLTGEELLDVLEKNSSGYLLMQVSGIEYSYDPQKPEGERIFEVSVNGIPLLPKKNYKVAINDYMLDHLENYIGKPKEEIACRIYPDLDRDVYIRAVKKQKRIDSEVEGRIKRKK